MSRFGSFLTDLLHLETMSVCDSSLCCCMNFVSGHEFYLWEGMWRRWATGLIPDWKYVRHVNSERDGWKKKRENFRSSIGAITDKTSVGAITDKTSVEVMKVMSHFYSM